MALLSNKFDEALAFASFLHRDQFRKDSDHQVPYISHLLRVAGLALEYQADETTAIAALLHDAVEDQGGMETAELIRQKFGSKVEAIVLECSDSTTPKDQKKKDWKQRKAAYISHFNNNPSQEAVIVCSCDKLDNLTCSFRQLQLVGLSHFDLFTTARDGFFWYYRSVLQALYAQKTPLKLELEACMQKIEALTEKLSFLQ
ncbi:MAG: HD domain-containing protein [Planctomycetia bacterium]|nr:HD domain-containing protein [Planctomycetia bacterium]